MGTRRDRLVRRAGLEPATPWVETRNSGSTELTPLDSCSGVPSCRARPGQLCAPIGPHVHRIAPAKALDSRAIVARMFAIGSLDHEPQRKEFLEPSLLLSKLKPDPPMREALHEYDFAVASDREVVAVHVVDL